MYRREHFEEEYLEKLRKYTDFGFEEIFYKDYSNDACEEDIKEFSQLLDFIIKDCPFFTKRDEHELWVCKNFLEKLNFIAIKTCATILVSVNSLGNSVSVNMSLENITICDKLLLMLKYAIMCCSCFNLDSEGITLTYEFNAAIPSPLTLWE